MTDVRLHKQSRRHPLVGALPLSVMMLAAFLVTFTILMARLHAGTDPALRAFANGSALTRGSSGHGPVVTRTSGGASAGAGSTPATAGGAPNTSRAGAVLTRTGGGVRGGEGDDA